MERDAQVMDRIMGLVDRIHQFVAESFLLHPLSKSGQVRQHGLHLVPYRLDLLSCQIATIHDTLFLVRAYTLFARARSGGQAELVSRLGSADVPRKRPPDNFFGGRLSSECD